MDQHTHLGRPVRLGKKAAQVVAGTPRLAKYLTASLPPPPDEVDWTIPATDYGMMLNDRFGCCTCATPGHMIQVATAANGKQVTVPDSEILKAYKAINPRFREDDPDTDTGAYVTDALDYWRDVGYRDADGKIHKIVGRAALDMRDPLQVLQGVALFGGVYFGVGLPVSAQNQPTWHVDLGSSGDEIGSWGGHALSLHAYRRGRDGKFVTWGAEQEATLNWVYGYADEAYVVVTEDWADADGAPNGLDKAQLLADLRAF